jgi:Tol biopolymer transport system component
VAGGEPFRVTSEEDETIAGVAWTKDGATLLFSAGEGSRRRLWSIPAAGGKAATLVTSAGDGVTDISIDRKSDRLAFSKQSGDMNIYELTLNQRVPIRDLPLSIHGGAPRQLTHDSSAYAPHWSRDGDWVYYTSGRTGRYEIWKTGTADGASRQVTRGGGSFPLESDDGRFVYYLRGREAGLWKVPVEGGEETPLIASNAGPRYWVVRRRGIYFLELSGQAAGTSQ